MRELAVFQLPV